MDAVEELNCQHCGREARVTYNDEVKARLIANNRCFECDFWVRMAGQDLEAANKERTIVTSKYSHYRIVADESGPAKFRGSYGRSFIVTWLDPDRAPSVTANLWSQGTVPERWRHMFKPNAEIAEGAIP